MRYYDRSNYSNKMAQANGILGAIAKSLDDTALDLLNQRPVDYNPSHLWLVKGQIHRVQKQFNRALEALTRARDLSTGSTNYVLRIELYETKAFLFEDMGQDKEAYHAMKQLVGLLKQRQKHEISKRLQVFIKTHPFPPKKPRRG